MTLEQMFQTIINQNQALLDRLAPRKPSRTDITFDKAKWVAGYSESIKLNQPYNSFLNGIVSGQIYGWYGAVTLTPGITSRPDFRLNAVNNPLPISFAERGDKSITLLAVGGPVEGSLAIQYY